MTNGSAALALTLLFACARPGESARDAGPSAAAKTATVAAADLERDVRVLASDPLEGRGPATEGIHKAAVFLEEKLAGAKLSPLFDGRFTQPFEMIVGTSLGEANTLARPGSAGFILGKDFEPFPFSATGRFEGEVVFAGFGIVAKEHGYDDYAGIDVAEKVVVVLSDEPGENDPKSPFDGKKPTVHASLRTKVIRAREAKARAILIVRDRIDARSSSRLRGTESDAGIIAIKVTPKVARQVLGFDPVALKRVIDASYKPQSRPGTAGRLSGATAIVREKKTVENVGAILIPPAATSTESVVLGAHYDHLGFGSWASLSGSDKPEVHPGADDNASGTAVVLEVARALAADPRGLDRRVIFVLFAGEEEGLLGSARFVKSPPVALGSIAAMVNLDMVGRLRDRRLHVMGTKTAKGLPELAQKIVRARGLDGSYGGDGYGPSDHTSFYAEGVPVLFLFTGAHEDYHRPTDTADRLSYPGMALIAEVAIDLVRALSSMHPRPEAIRASGPPPTLASGERGYGPYFGSIPDFGESQGGVRLTGVRGGSPAEKAGVQKGDVIVKFGGMTVTSLEDYTVALRSHAPGDVVEVEVRRGGEVKKLTATLTKRE
jgi:peptidase M28-like protein/PDZ domain-containing protein